MRIVADKNVCIGSGQCVVTYPEAFDQGEDDAVVVVLTEHPDDLDKAREAVDLCPSQALSLVED